MRNFGINFSYCRLLSLVLSLWLLLAGTFGAVTKNSVPFDPFRLECPFYHGIVKMELRRVESSEAIRTDTMMTAHCENVKKMHPSPRDRTAAPNDENCRWTAVFTLPGKNIAISATCSGKEFVAGVARQDLGEYNILCCKLKDRKRGECTTASFPWPSADNSQTLLEHRKRLLSSIGFHNGQVVGQFCEYEIMTKEELDHEFLANSKSLLINEFGPEEGKGNNRGTSGTIKQKVTGRLREFDLQTTKRPLTSQKSQAKSSAKSKASTPQIKSTTTRPRQKATTPSEYEYEYGDSAESEKQKSSTKNGGGGVVHVINEQSSGPDGESKTKPLTTTTTTRRTTTTTSTTRTTPSTTTIKTTTEATTTEATTTAATTTEATTEGESAALTADDASTAPPGGDDDYEDDGQTTGAFSPSATPLPAKKHRRTTTTATPTDEPEPEPDKPFGATVPDPSRFQILGIPKPPNKPKPHALFLQPPTDSQTKGRSTKKSRTKTTATTKESENTTSLAPAPSVQTGGDGSGDVMEMEHEASSAISSPSTSPIKNETTLQQTTGKKETTHFIELVTPPVPVGKLNVDTQDSAILLGNDTVESAVAPQVPQFGTRIPLRKWKTVGSTSTTVIPANEASTASTAGSGSGTTGVAEEANRIECDTTHASLDPVTKLVVACGQGRDIWSPPRCPENTFCLVAKDSTFRICCPVRVVRKR